MYYIYFSKNCVQAFNLLICPYSKRVYSRSMLCQQVFKVFKGGKMLERDIVKSITNYITKPRMGKSWKGFAWKNHGGLYSVKGLPDVMAVVRKGGKSFFLCFEVKQPGNKPTEIQKAIIRKFEDLGITARVVTSLDEVVKIIEELK